MRQSMSGLEGKFAMKKLKILITGFILWIGSVGNAQEEDTYRFGLLRQYDSVLLVKNREGLSLYRSLKNLDVTENVRLSVGGSWRFQAESFVNEQFNREGRQDNIWYLNRLMLHAHLKINDRLDFFAELGSGWVSGKDHSIPVDKDVLYVNQLFVKYKFTSNLDISVGRHNLRLGSGRLVDVREGPNVRRSFDFAEFNYQINAFRVKTFVSIPVQHGPHVFDNDYLNFDETFSGIYTTTHFTDATNFDAYFFYQKEDGVKYQSGIHNERRISIGVRHFGKYRKLTYNNEMVCQFGRFGNQYIRAWTLSFNLEKETIFFGKSVNIGMKAEAISGDRAPSDSKLNTFDALYPRGAYFGKVARFGPSNLIDVHPYMNMIFRKLRVEVDYAAFWRYSLEDGVYGPALTLDYPDLNNRRFIAHQIGAIAGYQLNNFINIELESNMIFPSGFLEASNKDDTLYHFVLTMEIKF